MCKSPFNWNQRTTCITPRYCNSVSGTHCLSESVCPSLSVRAFKEFYCLHSVVKNLMHLDYYRYLSPTSMVPDSKYHPLLWITIAKILVYVLVCVSAIRHKFKWTHLSFIYLIAEKLKQKCFYTSFALIGQHHKTQSI